jgi:hypothetical protein
MSNVMKPDRIRVARRVLAVVGAAIGVATAGVELAKLVRDLNAQKPAQYAPAVESNTCEGSKK